MLEHLLLLLKILLLLDCKGNKQCTQILERKLLLLRTLNMDMYIIIITHSTQYLAGAVIVDNVCSLIAAISVGETL